MIDQTVLWRALTFLVLVIMAITDYKTKTVPSALPFTPLLFGSLLASYLGKLGYEYDFYWMFMVGSCIAISIFMYLTNSWAIADSLTTIFTPITMFALEGVAFICITLISYVTIVLARRRSKKLGEFPLMPIIAGAYILALLIA